MSHFTSQWKRWNNHLTGFLSARGWLQHKLAHYLKREINDLFRWKNIASKWFNWSTHLSLKDSLSVKTNGIRLMVWFAPSVAQSKLSKTCTSLLVSFHKRINLLNEDKRSLFGKFPFSKPVSMKCRLGQNLWTMDWHTSVRTDHKLLNDGTNNEDECTTTRYMIPWIPRNLYASMGETH